MILVKIAVILILFHYLPKNLLKFLDALTGLAKVLIVTKPFLNNACMLLRKK
jgi:hypothetical protein